MAIKKYAVRVVQTMDSDGTEQNEGGALNGAFLDSLRYAGVVTMHETDSHRLGLTTLCFDIEAPPALDATGSRQWAEMNAERMRSFGFNAVAAPSSR